MLLHSSFFVKTFFKKIFKNLLEQVVGIEPTFPAWKAGVLPIYDTCIFGAKDGTRTRNIHLGKVALYQLSHFRIVGADEGSRTPTPKALDPKSSASANSATSASFLINFGGLPGNRTPDTLIKSQVLYRLS